MIHSMAGGELKFNQHFDFAKVEIIEGEDIGLIFGLYLLFLICK